MNTTQAQQKALEDALVALADCLEFGKCNMRLKTDIKSKEATFQVVLDTLALTPFYQAFPITADFPAIYMKEFWATVSVHKPSIRFAINKKKVSLDVDIFREILQDLGHTRDITYLTDVNVDYLHQPWRAFVTVINKCLSDKETGIDKIRIEYKDAKKTNKMSYPRFTKIIIDYFMSKDQSISRRNKMVWHTTQDDTMFTSMRCMSRHEDTHVYGTILPKELTNQAMLESNAYKTYYAFASGEKTPKPNEKEVRKGREGEGEGERDIDEEDDDEDDFDDDSDDNDESDDKSMKSDRDEIPDPNKTNKEHNEEEEEEYDDEFNIEEDKKIDHEETMNDDEDNEVTKELYDDVNVNLGNEDTKMTNVDLGASKQQNVSQESGFEHIEEDAHVTLTHVLNTHMTGGPTQSSSVSSDFTSKLLNLDNPSPADNEIASLMDTIAQHATVILEIISSFTTTVSPPPLFFNPLLPQETLTPTPTALDTTTSLPTLPDFDYVFRFNERVTNLKKDLSEIKQVDQYAQAPSSNPAIVDQEVQAEKREYIELVDSTVRTIIIEEFNAQLPQILPQAILVATPIIEKNVTESLEAAVLTRSYDKADYKKKVYDALVESYNTAKDLFASYGEVFLLKRSRVERDKDRDPFAGSHRGTKRRKSSKDAESSKDSKSKEKKSSSTSKDASQSQHKSFGKSAHVEEPSHTIEDSGMQQDQEFVTGNNDEQPTNKEVTKTDWFKKPERPPTLDPDWSKRQQVDFRPPQTWISQVVRAEEPPTSFDELNDTSFDFSAFVMNRLKILNLTQEILVGPAFNLLKGTCKSITELEYHLEEYHRGRQIIPQDYFINKDLEYLKGGDLSRRYSNSVTKTKAAIYNLKWIEDLVPNLWSPVTMKYNKHAYWGTSHWGPKRQRFYGFAANMSSSKDVYSRKRIIVVTRLSIMKKYDYGHLEEIEVRREDQKLYKRIVIQRRVEDLQLDVKSYQKKLNLTKLDTFSDGTLDDIRSALNDIAKGIRMEYLPKRKWRDLDKRRVRVMILDIDKKLFERRLMRNLEKFVGGREYGKDLKLLEMKI
ncbi:hypothetical protein Tco_0743177 [Tanacetum coccineum]